MKMMNDTISHAFIPGRLAKQKVVQAELEEKLSKSEESLTVAQTKSNVSRSFHRKRSQVESIGVKRNITTWLNMSLVLTKRQSFSLSRECHFSYV